jgi:hypothetical protein
VLGQGAPGPLTLLDLYTAPAATHATVSSITVCNWGGTDDQFAITVAPSGAAHANSQLLYNLQPIASNDTFVATIGITLGPTDVVRVISVLGSVSFSAFGVEVT